MTIGRPSQGRPLFLGLSPPSYGPFITGPKIRLEAPRPVLKGREANILGPPSGTQVEPTLFLVSLVVHLIPCCHFGAHFSSFVFVGDYVMKQTESIVQYTDGTMLSVIQSFLSAVASFQINILEAQNMILN